MHRVITSQHETKSPETYAAIVLPRGRAVPPPTLLKGALPPGLQLPLSQPRPPEMLMKLEQIIPDVRLTRSVDGPDGAELLPVGTVLSKRLLTHLYDLRELDDCVATLWVEVNSATFLQYCTATD